MISIVIPNYNGAEHLKVCFESLRDQTYRDHEIILIDNNSKDDSVKFTEENFPEVRIIKLNYNSGFAKAVNEGIRNSKGEYVLLLNNDTECKNDFLAEMISGFKSIDTGSVACKMLNFYERNMIDDAGDFIKLKGSPYSRGNGQEDKGQFDKEEYIFGACAGAAIYKKEVFEKAGYFDEDFFAYYEDVDMSFRMQSAGYKCFYNPKAICYHKRGATGKSMTGFETMMCEKNLVAVRLKNYPLSMLIKCFPFFMIVRIKRYYLFLTRYSYSLFKSAVKGYFKGLTEIPDSLRKRKAIQRNRIVSPEYLKSILK
ncbi:MAG: glycosyltransferase family 2 protein [Ignavibacteria bacterium]|nr:glycosyltransferase family 2 protein [Ignavibacteria bacterium]